MQSQDVPGTRFPWFLSFSPVEDAVAANDMGRLAMLKHCCLSAMGCHSTHSNINGARGVVAASGGKCSKLINSRASGGWTKGLQGAPTSPASPWTLVWFKDRSKYVWSIPKNILREVAVGFRMNRWSTNLRFSWNCSVAASLRDKQGLGKENCGKSSSKILGGVMCCPRLTAKSRLPPAMANCRAAPCTKRRSVSVHSAGLPTAETPRASLLSLRKHWIKMPCTKALRSSRPPITLFAISTLSASISWGQWNLTSLVHEISTNIIKYTSSSFPNLGGYPK